MSNNSEDRDYRVGYGRPPRDKQFKPGQSGNPRGLKPKERSFAGILENQIGQMITVKAGGRETRMTRREALVLRVLERALAGDAKSLDRVLKADRPNQRPDRFELTAYDEKEIELALKRAPRKEAVER